MKTKHLYILISTSTFFQAYSQIGINTQNPQAVFHIDGKKDNNITGTPSVLQQANDFTVNTQGYVGLGTAVPSVRLEINNGTDNGAIKIVDGTQGVSKVLTSDANGIGSWQTPASIRPTYLGTYPVPSLNVVADGGVDPKYTGSYIDLTQGKWIVSAGMTITNGIVDSRLWLQAFLSSSPSILSANGFTYLGPGGSSTAFAGALTNSSTGVDPIAGDGSLNFIAGNIIVNVTDPITRIYLLIENDPANSWSYSSGSHENYFYAIPVN